jgi:predicted MPP superfamily phosphohydrolase
MNVNQQFQILHISDLHINDSGGESFDRKVVLDPLIRRVAKDLEKGFRPEMVAVTGDIAFKGVTNEYELAKGFFDDLLKALELGGERLFIVPGNHDLNRKKYRPKDIPVYDNMRELNTELEDDDFRSDLLKGMADYFAFVQNRYGHLTPVQDRLVPFVHCFTAACGKKIGLVGLNSAWMCRRQDDQGTIAVGEYQIQTAMAALQAHGDVDLRIILQHHPLQWLWPTDRTICRTHMNNCVLLAGHLHEARGGYTADLDGAIYTFQAGGAYLGTESDYPGRFHYITFDWDKLTVRLDFRKFVPERRQWSLDGDIGDDGAQSFPLISAGQPETAIPEKYPQVPEAYVDWIADRCRYMDLDQLQVEGEAVRAELPEIFIPLYGHDPDKKIKATARPEEEDDRTTDIETLIGKYPHLLIEGDAGSGKTTLIKHLAFCLATGRLQDIKASDLTGWLPVLIFVKDLKGFFTSEAYNADAPLTVEILLDYYCHFTGQALDRQTIDRFCRAGRAIFLLDGLDEIDPAFRERVVNTFALLKNLNKGCRIVLSGRPHGIAGAARQKFGKHHVRILSLDQQQVESFIRKWFQHIYTDSSAMGGTTANAMISEVRAHPAIEQLIENPLMLTATCILYYGGKQLPGQRAELYKKFVNNLLHRRFGEPEKILTFLSTLAFKMFEAHYRGADKFFAVERLEGIFHRSKQEDPRAYRKRLEKRFSDIELRCGLLVPSEGQYSFRHLTFQEYLTAVYIVDNHTDYVRAIETHWDDPRYEEVIELYIGYLSIKNKLWTNTIVQKMLEGDDKESFYRWRLAARALLDIHPGRRDIDVVDMAAEKLRVIIEKGAAAEVLADAGETLGRLGDRRDLEWFIPIDGGEYPLDKGKVQVDAFEISKYPVTNQWYAKFIAAGGYDNPGYWDEDGRKWLASQETHMPVYWHAWRFNCPNAPVVGVSFYEAMAFCNWLTETRRDGRTYRLPDKNQWEASAAGFEGRKYPWGEWKEDACNTNETEIGKTSAVGIFFKGNTPGGVSDMAGNVWEWTASKDEDGDLVVRGGSWFYFRDDARCANRNRSDPDLRYDFVGFRCVRT